MVYVNPSKDLKFDLGRIAFSLLPLSPETVGRRKTILTEVVTDEVWTLDQLQGIINVNGTVVACLYVLITMLRHLILKCMYIVVLLILVYVQSL